MYAGGEDVCIQCYMTDVKHPSSSSVSRKILTWEYFLVWLPNYLQVELALYVFRFYKHVSTCRFSVIY